MQEAKTNRIGLELQERDLAIFRGLFESRLMTLDHITRLYFGVMRAGLRAPQALALLFSS
jgi:hypothetical protein